MWNIMSQTACESPLSLSLSISLSLSKCANGFKSPHITSVCKRAARSTVDRNFHLHNRGSVVSSLKYINFFFFLPVFNHLALSWRPCANTHLKRTHNARFTHTRTNTVCIAYAHYAVIGAYFFRAHVNGSECSYCTQLWCVIGAVRLQQCSTCLRELKWQRIVLYEPQDCL